MTLAQMGERGLPAFVRDSGVALKYLHLLGVLDWDRYPQRGIAQRWPGHKPLPDAPFVAAFLVKLDQGFEHTSQLRDYLVEHPALVWVLGFPLVSSGRYTWGFDAAASLPTHRHFSRVLRELPNDNLQWLLDNTVCLVRQALPPECPFGQAVSLDTKHILAWVKENNPKTYIKEGRFDKARQPVGDPDCRLGCKRKRNISPPDGKSFPATPTKEGQSASKLGVGIGEYYWGYASGIVVTKVPEWGEFVLAELTQTFDQSDASYFFPLMKQVERRLGFKPPFGTADAAFDAFYVHEYFFQAGGFAAVPLAPRGGQENRQFSADGLPCCAAGLAMPLKLTFLDRSSTLFPHERGRYVCPLLYPQPTGELCPIVHKNWEKGGCVTTMATSRGARIRYQLDRQSQSYKQLYKQRTASERINSQALALGIEHPKLRNYTSIANQNTLIYLLINLRGVARIKAHWAEMAQQTMKP